MRFKQIIAESTELDEVKMSPGRLEKFAQGEGSVMTAGFEAELIFADAGGDQPQSEPDYGYDERATNIPQIIQFFSDNMTSSELMRVERALNRDFDRWLSQHYYNDEFQEHAQENILLWMTESGKYANAKSATEEELDTLAEKEARHPHGIIYNNALLWCTKQWKKEGMDEDPMFEMEMESQQEEWLNDAELQTMSAINEVYDTRWPYYQDDDDGERGFEIFAEPLANSLSKATSWNTEVYGWHGARRPRNTWVLEPDPSIHPDGDEDLGVEIVSPPMPLNKCIASMEEFFAWAQDNDAYANESTGFHMSVSLPDQESENIDFIKLVLFLGDNHVLEQFNRLGNDFCKSAFDKLQGRGKDIDIPQAFNLIGDGLETIASKSIISGLGFGEKYVSVNPKYNYIEFRSAGGPEYFEDIKYIQTILKRYAFALKIASDPTAYRREYVKKFYKMLSGLQYDPDTLKYFAMYMAGQITRDSLKDWIRASQNEREGARNPKWYQVDYVGEPARRGGMRDMAGARLALDIGSVVMPGITPNNAISRAKKTWSTGHWRLEHVSNDQFVVREIGPYIPGKPKPKLKFEHPSVEQLKKMEAERAKQFPDDKEGHGQMVGYGGWGPVTVR